MSTESQVSRPEFTVEVYRLIQIDKNKCVYTSFLKMQRQINRVTFSLTVSVALTENVTNQNMFIGTTVLLPKTKSDKHIY